MRQLLDKEKEKRLDEEDLGGDKENVEVVETKEKVEVREEVSLKDDCIEFKEQKDGEKDEGQIGEKRGDMGILENSQKIEESPDKKIQTENEEEEEIITEHEEKPVPLEIDEPQYVPPNPMHVFAETNLEIERISMEMEDRASLKYEEF